MPVVLKLHATIETSERAANKAVRILTALAADPSSIHKYREKDPAFMGTLLRRARGYASGIETDFLCTEAQLDCTQPEDVGYGTPECEVLRQARRDAGLEVANPNPRLSRRLSHAKNLSVEVLGKNVLYHGKYNPGGIIPEFSHRGNRRCIYVGHDGRRCLSFSDQLVCGYHMQIVVKRPDMQDRFMSSLKALPLKEAYQRHLVDPARKGVESELALMRTMLDSVLLRTGNYAELKDMPIAEISAIMKMCEIITHSVEKMATIEAKMQMRMSIDQVGNILANFCDFIKRTLQPTAADYDRLIKYVETSPLFQRTEFEGPLANAQGFGQNDQHQIIKETTLAAQHGSNDTIKEVGDAVEIRKELVPSYQATRSSRNFRGAINPYINPNDVDVREAS